MTTEQARALALSFPDIHTAVDARPHVCAEVWWGKRLRAVRVALDRGDSALLSDLLADAWEGKTGRPLAIPRPGDGGNAKL